jgi:hypothetical protein
VVRGLCAVVGGEEVHADVGRAFAEVVGFLSFLFTTEPFVSASAASYSQAPKMATVLSAIIRRTDHGCE